MAMVGIPLWPDTNIEIRRNTKVNDVGNGVTMLK